MSDRVLHDVAYAMRRLGVSRATLDRLLDVGELAYVDIATHVDSGQDTKGLRRNRCPRFLDEDLDAFIARRRVAAQAPAETQPTTRHGGSRTRLQLVGAGRYR